MSILDRPLINSNHQTVANSLFTKVKHNSHPPQSKNQRTKKSKMTRPLLSFLVLLLSASKITVLGFSTPNSNNSGNSEARSTFTLFDRFRPECPANPQSIHSYDPTLLQQPDTTTTDDEPVWVAVFRTSNNAPSVFVKDEFLNAMRLATGGLSELPPKANNNNMEHQIETSSGKGFGASSTTSSSSSSSKNVKASNEADSSIMTKSNNASPVAVARLCPSADFPGTWTLDNMRCSLKKETQDESCEGGSEHKEALSVAIDALLLHYLSSNNSSSSSNNNSQQKSFEGAIRSKATLVGASLLEERGFQPVEELSKDMATHVSSLDGSMEAFAEKYVQSMTTKNQGARDRAEKILSMLGRLDRDRDLQQAIDKKKEDCGDDKGSDDDDYDPWASIKQFI